MQTGRKFEAVLSLEATPQAVGLWEYFCSEKEKSNKSREEKETAITNDGVH
jgi:hypothetical protein